MDFNSLKTQITDALNKKFSNQGAFPGESSGFTLVDGFVMQTLQEQAQGFVIGGKSVPMIMVVGNSTGRVYYFALKALLPSVTKKQARRNKTKCSDCFWL